MENPIKMDDLGVPLFFGNIHIAQFGPEDFRENLRAQKNEIGQDPKPLHKKTPCPISTSLFEDKNNLI